MKNRSLRCDYGAALIIVLAFIVLLAALVTAYFARTTTNRQVAHGSFNQTKSDQVASSAIGIIIGDLRQEIANGSSSVQVNPTPATGSSVVYTPTAAANMVPMRSGNPVDIPNLIRRSVRSDTILAPGLGSRASAVNSTTDVSANGRSVTLRRWNGHYLIPKANTGDDQTDPTASFVAPDWVMVTAEKSAAILATPTRDSNGNTVTAVGRYAYAIYDEGGLLDMNVAGYPNGTALSQYGRKGSLAFADLSVLPLPSPITNSAAPFHVDRIIGWRNYGTTQPANNFPDTAPTSQAFAKNFQTSSVPAANYNSYVLNNPTGFLTVRSTPSPSPYPWNNRTDQMFLSRQELIAYEKTQNTSNGNPISNTTQFDVNALQSMGTITRESTAPSWSPATPGAFNPDFRTLRVTASFTRNDGTAAAVGEPLVKKRFLLQRLNWLTYKGPSGPSTANPTGRTLTDPDISILVNTFGLTSTFLQQGTDQNILKYFGLGWDTANDRWNYVGHNGSTTPVNSLATLGTLTGTREPDFFELLQAGILNASVGDSLSSDASLPIVHQQSKMLHLLTVGANLIAQSRTDSYPVRIACSVDVGGTATIMEATGSTRLPYLNSLAACAVAATGAPGGVNWFLVPNLWDPYRNTWDLKEPSPVPQYPRPQVRLRVNGTAAFGSVGVATPTPTATPAPTPTPTPSPAPTPTPTP